MTGRARMHIRWNWKRKTIAALLLGAASLWAGTGRLSTRGGSRVRADYPAGRPATVRTVSDDAAARAAFLAAAPVFTHPRCQNCHPAGDAPLQGDDSHPHAQNVRRGKDGKGRFAMKCANCHQDANLPGENMPPGNPTWHLPSADVPLVFQGKSPAELARQLK